MTVKTEIKKNVENYKNYTIEELRELVRKKNIESITQKKEIEVENEIKGE